MITFLYMVQISSQKNIKMFFSSLHIVLVANWLMDDSHLGYITILEGRKIFLILCGILFQKGLRSQIKHNKLHNCMQNHIIVLGIPKPLDIKYIVVLEQF